MSKPQRIEVGQNRQELELPHKVKVKMPDGKRGVVRGRSWLDCLNRAAQLGAAFVIDRANHRWRHDGNGRYTSVGVIGRA